MVGQFPNPLHSPCSIFVFAENGFHLRKVKSEIENAERDAAYTENKDL